ncbi:MAG: LysE family translocator [Alphaproteobacteria bacterium]|nr:LysE family translocator [Alphaproteobacteria bacterium]
MLDPELLPVFVLGAAALAVTPGPDMMFTLATAAARGRPAGLGAVAGIISGGLIWTVASALGLAALVAANPHSLMIVRYAGAAYLIWLAYRTFRSLNALPEGEAASDLISAFRRGFVTNLLNPKIGLFFLAFLPQFTNTEIGPIWLQMLLLGAIFFAIGTLVLIIVALAAGAARDHLARSPQWRRRLNALAGTAFGGLGLRLLFTGNTP